MSTCKICCHSFVPLKDAPVFLTHEGPSSHLGLLLSSHWSMASYLKPFPDNAQIMYIVFISREKKMESRECKYILHFCITLSASQSRISKIYHRAIWIGPLLPTLPCRENIWREKEKKWTTIQSITKKVFCFILNVFWNMSRALLSKIIIWSFK